MLRRIRPLAERPNLSLELLDATWMDDLSLLLTAPNAQALETRAREGASCLIDACLSHALLPNLSRGKTEALLSFRAAGTKEIKHRVYHEQQGALTLNCALWPDATLRATPAYKHLGGILHHGGKLEREVRFRTAQAWSSFNSRKRHVFASPLVPWEQKMVLFDTLVATVLFYGSGTWTNVSERLATPEIWALAHFEQDWLQYVRDSIQWLWTLVDGGQQHSTHDEAWEHWSAEALTSPGKWKGQGNRKATDDGLCLEPVTQAEGPLALSWDCYIEDEAQRPSAEVLSCLGHIDFDVPITQLPTEELWSRLRTSFSCVCLQGTRFRATAEAWHAQIILRSRADPDHDYESVLEAGKWLCQADYADWLVPTDSGKRAPADTFRQGHLLLQLLEFGSFRFTTPRPWDRDMILIQIGDSVPGLTDQVPTQGILTYTHQNLLQDVAAGRSVDLLQDVDPDSAYCISTIGP
ncbi:unnamed protein product [Symbiodinium sp. CCMP2592]|nr:unnamed protein product [Symbiodinium sp. CCMP2592]